MKSPRKPIKSGQPPKRTKYLPRGTRPIRARKKDASKRRFAKHRCQPYLDWLKQQPCCVTGKRSGEWTYVWVEDHHEPYDAILVDPAHIKARGTGGDDMWNAIPLAHHLHELQHRIGIKTFWKRYDCDPVVIAARYTEQFLREFPEFGGLRGSDPQ